MNCQHALVIIVDILQAKPWAIATTQKDSQQNKLVMTAFNTQIDGELMALGNLVSRKKQFVPAIKTLYQYPSSS